MSCTKFIVKEHIIPCHHIREEFITSSPDDPCWQMQAKQYIPRNNLSPKEGDITVISSHANGFPMVNTHRNNNFPSNNQQELYEPFWDDLLAALNTKNLKIRNIFIITHPHLSPSSLNPELVQDGSRLGDAARDLLSLVNQFRQTILHPIMGIGHSVGASHLVSLSLMHPSLFTSLVLIEPIITDSPSEAGVEKLAMAAIRRRRDWKTRAEAEEYFGKVWSKWDARARERWNASALIPCDANFVDGKTELAWDRLQELDAYMDTSELWASAVGASVATGKGSAAWIPFPPQIWERLKDLAVHTVFVCGSESEQHAERTRKHWKDFTGTNEKFWPRGFQRKVELLEMVAVGHLVPMEAASKCAELVGVWIDEEMKMWRKEWDKNRRWRHMSEKDKCEAVASWMAGLKSRI
jgi:pimeloyl-ACP methyl ester carboxylesterase